MLSFLRKAKKKGKDSVISSSQLLGNEESSIKNISVKPTLYFHPSWSEIAQEQKYIYQFLNKDLGDLQENQISLAGIEAEKQNDAYYVTTFIRNTVSQSIKLETITLQLLNKDEQLCARKAFHLSDLGVIPANTNMPWVFIFETDTMTEACLSKEDWQLVFELKPEHKLDFDPTWEAQLTDNAKERLQKIVADLTPPAENEINFLGLQTELEESGELHATMFIRNGYNQNVKLEKLPLHISDASGDVIAKGIFTLANFTLKANSTKPWTFTFPANLLVKKDIDLSTWKAFVPQSKES
ncbi:accessory Sec system S-layer assembly protein [Bacillus sp. XF8]|uniref:accessory Sec system S-layer assembly protein n=1 Tax=Bacillus sp. XF8 TaxID=2819289 RepID=UPI001AA01E2A|nr:accessory Sec system S-layer assembly protein [Bacillus sp. XF8]MBO1581553.1 accessory Sec system S-layer assembly protein [Bacillus sp. XF8]